MSDSKLEEKVPQMLNMLNHVNLGMTEVARTLMALERHGHTHPGDLATLSGQVTQLQAIVGQLQSFLGVQAKGIAVTQTPAVPPGRSEILAAGAQDMASSLIKYVEGVDAQKKALEEHHAMTPTERAKKYQQLLVSFFDPSVRTDSAGLLKPGYGKVNPNVMPYNDRDELAMDAILTGSAPTFFTHQLDGEPEVFFFQGKHTSYLIDFTAIEAFFDFGRFYMLLPKDGKDLSNGTYWYDLSIAISSAQNQVYAAMLDDLTQLLKAA